MLHRAIASSPPWRGGSERSSETGWVLSSLEVISSKDYWASSVLSSLGVISSKGNWVGWVLASFGKVPVNDRCEGVSVLLGASSTQSGRCLLTSWRRLKTPPEADKLWWLPIPMCRQNTYHLPFQYDQQLSHTHRIHTSS